MSIARSDDIAGSTEAAVRDELAAFEEAIEDGLLYFAEAGLALSVIRDERLYRHEFTSFDRYCRERWGWTRRRADQLVAAAELSTIVLTAKVPILNEGQARELAPLRDDPDAATAAVTAAHEKASDEGRRMTAADIREQVRGPERVIPDEVRSPGQTEPTSRTRRTTPRELKLDPDRVLRTTDEALDAIANSLRRVESELTAEVFAEVDDATTVAQAVASMKRSLNTIRRFIRTLSEVAR